MKNCREEWYDSVNRVAVTRVEVSDAAFALARGHLSGPTATYYLVEALAAAALLGSEMSEKDETLILQMKCTGPLGGFNVECTADGTLRGYTEKKVLDDFDGKGSPDDEKVLGRCQFQVTRSVPGRILSQGIATSLNGYLADSLQRNAMMRLEADVDRDVNVIKANGLLVEALPDSKVSRSELMGYVDSPTLALKKSTPLAFACRCSADRAVAMLSAMDADERKGLPDTIDITCHMCGRTFTVRTK